MILRLAEKYGRSPEEVESWDAYWFERAAVDLEAASIDSQRRVREMNKRR